MWAGQRRGEHLEARQIEGLVVSCPMKLSKMSQACLEYCTLFYLSKTCQKGVRDYGRYIFVLLEAI